MGGISMDNECTSTCAFEEEPLVQVLGTWKNKPTDSDLSGI